jgi:hypothetical protein
MTARPAYHLVSLGVSVLATVGWYFPGIGLAAVPFLDAFVPPLSLKSLIYHFIPFWMTMGLFCLVLIVKTAVFQVLKRNARRPTRQRADKGTAIRAMVRIGFLGVAAAATLYWTGYTLVEGAKMTPVASSCGTDFDLLCASAIPFFHFVWAMNFFMSVGIFYSAYLVGAAVSRVLLKR